MSRPLPAGLAADLDRLVADAQRDWRSPSVSVRVVRRGEPVLDVAHGAADLGEDGTAPEALLAPGPDVQYRMGSITKTFTAVLVLQARDAGLLDLDDRLDAHLDVPAHGELTVRRMLSHLSGLQREPVGEVWESLEGPDVDGLVEDLTVAERVLEPHQRWHYSNLAFALLGQVVAARRGTTWEDALAEHVLAPLGLSRTTVAPTAPVARGYFPHPWADRLLPEPLFPGHGFAPAGELWSTTTDLGRWASFLADPDPAVLSPDTVAQMCHLHAMADLERWSLGWGLGLMLHRRGERLLVGHDGAMPGFLAGLVVDRRATVGAVVLANTSRSADPGGLAISLVEKVLDGDPEPPPTWRPATSAVPADVEGLLGHWWTEGVEFVCSWRALDPTGEPCLQLRAVAAPAWKPPAVLRRDGADDAGNERWRVVSGREQGEVLRVVRGPDGVPARLYWATYPVTREPLPFGT